MLGCVLAEEVVCLEIPAKLKSSLLVSEIVKKEIKNISKK